MPDAGERRRAGVGGRASDESGNRAAARDALPSLRDAGTNANLSVVANPASGRTTRSRASCRADRSPRTGRLPARHSLAGLRRSRLRRAPWWCRRRTIGSVSRSRLDGTRRRSRATRRSCQPPTALGRRRPGARPRARCADRTARAQKIRGDQTTAPAQAAERQPAQHTRLRQARSVGAGRRSVRIRERCRPPVRGAKVIEVRSRRPSRARRAGHRGGNPAALSRPQSAVVLPSAVSRVRAAATGS